MNALANTETHLPSRLDELARQAQLFAQNACMNLLQLGRVLAEARPMIPYGEFDGWCRQNAKMSKRTAEQYMQAYAEFGLNTKIAELGTSKVIKLLPMSEDEREQLLAENDVGSMSTRQLDEAIRKQRGQLLKEARAEAKEEIERHAETAKALLKEKLRLEREAAEHDEDMAALQADYNAVRDELLAYKSADARGEDEHKATDTLTPDAFTSAVNAFIGKCCRLPQMGRAFSAMPPEEKEAYEQSLCAIEKWAESARIAMNSVSFEEAIFVD